MVARYILAGAVGAALMVVTIGAVLWLHALQSAVVAAAVEAQRARVAAEGVAALVTGAPAPRRAPPPPTMRREP